MLICDLQGYVHTIVVEIILRYLHMCWFVVTYISVGVMCRILLVSIGIERGNIVGILRASTFSKYSFMYKLSHIFVNHLNVGISVFKYVFGLV